MFKRVVECFILLGLLFIGYVGCADRQHANPMDPLNPETRGRPVGLRVTPDKKTVTLIWEPISLKGFLGIRIMRKEGEMAFEEIARVKEQSFYVDTTVSYGVPYCYTIQAIFENYESPFSDTVKITPGPSEVWVAGGFSGVVFKLSHDASHLLATIDFFLYPYGIAEAGEDGGIYLTDFYLDQVVRIANSGQIIRWMSGYQSPTEIEFDVRKHHFWLADRDASVVIVADSSGQEIERFFEIPYPEALSLNQNDDICWVADSKSRIVAKLRTSPKNATIFTQFNRAWDIAVNQSTGDCWVADSNRVVRLDQAGEMQVSVSNFMAATSVAVNSATGECWVIDYHANPGKSKVVKLSASGEKLLEISGLFRPYSLDVDTFDGSCIVADTWNSRILKVSANGEILSDWSASAAPTTVKVIHR